MQDNDEPIYHVQSRGGQFIVLDATGYVAMTCLDEQSATQYCLLLNQAYRKGYKMGYRDGRRRSEEPS